MVPEPLLTTKWICHVVYTVATKMSCRKIVKTTTESTTTMTSVQLIIAYICMHEIMLICIKIICSTPHIYLEHNVRVDLFPSLC